MLCEARGLLRRVCPKARSIGLLGLKEFVLQEIASCISFVAGFHIRLRLTKSFLKECFRSSKMSVSFTFLVEPNDQAAASF
jgi:hypothetical protein